MSAPLRLLPRDGRLLFVARSVRLFAYGALSVVLVIYLTSLGLTPARTGTLLTLILAGDVVVSLYLTTRADRFGRRRTLIAGAVLMVIAGVVIALTKDFTLLVIAGTIGVISPTGHEVGPFLPVEQAALTQLLPDDARTSVFAWYQLVGAGATALGSLAGGFLAELAPAPAAATTAYRSVILLYAALGVLLVIMFARLSPAIEVETSSRRALTGWGITRSGVVVARLSALFALDSFGGGFVVQSFVAYWFHVRFGVEPQMLGAIFFGANLFAGISALLATRLASRIGLVNTMVFTHLPSNVLLILVPLMPTLPLAIAVLLLRFSISQMDVPIRQSYVMAVVGPEERSAAAGITGVAKTVGAAVAPVLAGALYARPSLMAAPFFVAGGLKIVYDLLLYRGFVTHRPPEEQGRQAGL